MRISYLSQFPSFACILFTYCLANFTVISSQCLEDQKSLLFELKNSLVFDSSISRKLVQWNQAEDCCRWSGVECDDAGHVISLQLDGDGISGVSENLSSLSSLGYLAKLNLAYNDFNCSQIPSGIHNLRNLTHLNLSDARFGGQIPFQLSGMKRLVSLDLSSFLLSSSCLQVEDLNLKMLLKNLTGLRELYLDGVDISSQETDWWHALSSSVPNLTRLSLRGCNLSRPIDSSILNLRSLSVLQLDDNNLSATVPDLFANFSSLTTLSLSFCSLEGIFPGKIFQVPNLENLDLSSNGLLRGTIAQFPRTGAFRTIVLSYTNFSGPLPDSIGNLGMLSVIDFSNCKFNGSIPSTLGKLKELVHVDLSFNFFTGSVLSLNKIKKIEYIDLSRNSLTGSVSSMHLEDHSNLVYMNLGYNSLNGSIPRSLFVLPSLQKLLLSNNKFSGRVSEFSDLRSSNIDSLDLSSNLLEGSIPDSLFKLESLRVLSLSNNFFNGTAELEKVQKNLTTLDLSYNNLTVNASSSNSSLSALPQFNRLALASCNFYSFPDLKKQSGLSYLDLSNNHIVGKIPSWIWEIGSGELMHLNLSFNMLTGLESPYQIPSALVLLDLNSNRLQGNLPMPPPDAIYVDFSNNNFEGQIPHNFTSPNTFLSLANNSLSGAIPESLCNSTYLQVLDLSANKLIGKIPPCLVERMGSSGFVGFETKNLGVLNLRGNNISGDIPDAFPVYCGLKTLDISNNNLGGDIPPSLANCGSLEVMNVGSNKIGGTFPCMLSSSLRVLVLRSNRFHGEVRCGKSWPSLQIIDIASNNFSGYLYPESLTSWRGMVLDNDERLSPNHLRFEFLRLNNFYYQDDVTLTVKGLEQQIVKILRVFTSIDLSCNSFHGEIPDEIGDLSSLYILNLSHNALTGRIPKAIGNLSQLGSLDLSRNHLTGEIPLELTGLTFLSFLNLSYNNLVGKIPIGSQFQTFTENSYMENTGLCSYPLNKNCTAPIKKSGPVQSSQENEIEWEYVSAALGYVVGLGSTLWLLFGWQSLNDKFSEQFDQILSKTFDGKGRRRGGRGIRRN